MKQNNNKKLKLSFPHCKNLTVPLVVSLLIVFYILMPDLAYGLFYLSPTYVGNHEVKLWVETGAIFEGRLYRNEAFIQYFGPGTGKHYLVDRGLSKGVPVTYKMDIYNIYDHELSTTEKFTVTPGQVWGTVDENMTWSGQWSLVGTVRISKDATLTISGATVIKHEEARFYWENGLIAPSGSGSLIISGATLNDIPVMPFNTTGSIKISGSTLNKVKIGNSGLKPNSIEKFSVTDSSLCSPDIYVAAATIEFNGNKVSCPDVVTYGHIRLFMDQGNSASINWNKLPGYDLNLESLDPASPLPAVPIAVLDNNFRNVEVVSWAPSGTTVSLNHNTVGSWISIKGINGGMEVEGNRAGSFYFTNDGAPTGDHRVGNNDASYSMEFDQSSHLKVENNRIFCSDARHGGLYFIASTDNDIAGNHVENCYFGIDLWGTTDGAVQNNTIRDNVFQFNTVSVRLIGPVTNNVITNNIFSGPSAGNSDVSKLDCSGPCPNTWNLEKKEGKNIIGGLYSGGNYWSDYRGQNSDRDGLGDTPHLINDYNIDNLPLVFNFIVNSASDHDDPSPGDGMCDTGNVVLRGGNEEAECTLRAALAEAKAVSGKNLIAFDIPDTDNTVPFISPGSSLPEITNQVLLNAATQPFFSKVILDGTGAGEANGLTFRAQGEIKGLVIQNFRKEGVSAHSELLTLKNVEILANCGWGVKTQGDLTILAEGDAVNRVNNNGSGPDCQGGGIWSRDGRISAASIEVTDNNGPGILAARWVELYSVKSNYNKGPGIKSFLEYVYIDALAVGPIAGQNEVIGNKGYGIYSRNFERNPGLAWRPDVDVRAAIDVSNNGLQGIYAVGDININTIAGSAKTDKVSRVNNNGKGTDKGTECWDIEEMHADLAVVPCEGGGILSEQGGIQAHFLEVTGNGGPGIIANENVSISVGKVCANQGEGIISKGGVTLVELQVCDNQSTGVLISQASMALSVAPLSDTATIGSSITGSTLFGNAAEGIRFAGNTPFTISGSNIYGNTGAGISNTGQTMEVVARGNWWGDVSGPGGDGAGSGDEVTGNVDFSNWADGPVTLVAAASSDRAGAAGTEVIAAQYMANFSDAEDTYMINITDTRGWVIYPSVLTETLRGNESRIILFNVSIPQDCADGLWDEISITATSLTYPQLFATALMKVTVKTVLINEVHPGEGWVELFNPGPGDIGLAGWRIAGGASGLDFTIPEHGLYWDGLLEQGAYLVIRLRTVDERDIFYEVIDAGTGTQLHKAGDSVVLLNPRSDVIDFMQYGDVSVVPPPGAAWNGENPQAPALTQSLGRNRNGLDTNDGSDWEHTGGVDSHGPTPGRVNAPAAVISINPITHNFSSVAVGGAASFFTLIVRDIGEQDLEIEEISLQGRNVSGFSILNDTCSNRTLTPSSACTLDVIMSPEVYGDHLAYFQIPSNDPIRPLLRGLLRGIGQCFYGDANEDGRINIQDALIDLRIISQSIEPPAELCKADMDGNGRVDLGDVIKMLSILVNSKR